MKEAIRTTLSPAQTKSREAHIKVPADPGRQGHAQPSGPPGLGVYLLTAGGPTPVGPCLPPIPEPILTPRREQRVGKFQPKTLTSASLTGPDLRSLLFRCLASTPGKQVLACPGQHPSSGATELPEPEASGEIPGLQSDGQGWPQLCLCQAV